MLIFTAQQSDSVIYIYPSQVVLVVKNPPANGGNMRHEFHPWEDPLEEDMATHSSRLAWRIQWTEEPGGLWTTGSKESDRAELTLHEQVMYKALYYKLYPNTISETTSC